MDSDLRSIIVVPMRAKRAICISLSTLYYALSLSSAGAETNGGLFPSLAGKKFVFNAWEERQNSKGCNYRIWRIENITFNERGEVGRGTLHTFGDRAIIDGPRSVCANANLSTFKGVKVYYTFQDIDYGTHPPTTHFERTLVRDDGGSETDVYTLKIIADGEAIVFSFVEGLNDEFRVNRLFQKQ